MSEYSKADIVGTVLILVLIVGLIFMVGHARGVMVGQNRAWENDKKWDCEREFSNSPYREIHGKCLKYFVEEK